MAWVRRALVILQVTSHARGAAQRVVVVEVAIGALPRRHGVQTGQREPGGGVVKFAVGPLHRVMALLARGREAGMGHRRRGGVVGGLVAADACRAGNAVVVVDVTVAALPRRYGVRASEREPGFCVIERGRLPGRSVMARVTGLCESTCDVVRVRGVLKILQVTRYASGARQIVVVVGVAIATLPRWNPVGAGQNEVHHRVVEARRRPCNR